MSRKEKKMKLERSEALPLPFAVHLAKSVAPKIDADGTLVNAPTADDEVSGMTTYTDD